MSSTRKQVSLAVGGSLLLHVLFLFTWALAVRALPPPKPPGPTPAPLHLEMVKQEETPPPAPEPTLPVLKIPYLDTSSRPLAEHPPDKPVFESNQDTAAASRLAAAGGLPLPSQEGKKTPTFHFDTTAYTPGQAPATASAETAAAPPPQPETAPAPPTPRPVPSHTPVPDDEFGLPVPTPTPEDAEPAFDPAFRAPASTAPERPTVASRAANASNAVGFQASQQVTSVSGTVGRKGDASVDSLATPVGRYRSRVINAIKTKWYTYFNARSDIISFGMVRIRLVIDRSGKVRMPKVLSNSSNEAMEAVSVQALMDAPIPPMPPEAMAVLPGGELSMDLTFNAE